MVTRHDAHAHAQLLNQKFYEIEDTNTHFKSMKRTRSFAKCITDLLYICMHYKQGSYGIFKIIFPEFSLSF